MNDVINLSWLVILVTAVSGLGLTYLGFKQLNKFNEDPNSEDGKIWKFKTWNTPNNLRFYPLSLIYLFNSSGSAETHPILPTTTPAA